MKLQENISLLDQHVIDFVRKLRTDRNLTQQDIADILGVSRSFISDVESNNRPAKYNFRHLNALSDYFSLSPKDFMPKKAFPVD